VEIIFNVIYLLDSYVVRVFFSTFIIMIVLNLS